MSAAADRLFDDYWFVLARPGRARGPGGDQGRPVSPAMRKTLLDAVKRKPQAMVKITSLATTTIPSFSDHKDVTRGPELPDWLDHQHHQRRFWVNPTVVSREAVW